MLKNKQTTQINTLKVEGEKYLYLYFDICQDGVGNETTNHGKNYRTG